METSLLTIISLFISYVTIYGVVYFIYVYLKRDSEPEATLFHPDVSMIIPAHNEAANISSCIKSLLSQDYDGKIEIIVLDDGSTDGTRKIVSKYASVRFIQSSKPGRAVGKTITVNKGVLLAKHELVGVLDADSYLDVNAIKNMVRHFESPVIGAVVPIVKVHNPRNLIEKMQMIEYTLSMCVRKIVSNTGALFMTHGVGTIFRKSALKKVGLFEAKTLTEDLNIGLKLIKAGYKLASSFNAVGYTVVPSTAKHVIKQRLRWNGGLFENSYWFRDIFFNKDYGNLGLFVLPINLFWSGVTVYIALMGVRDLLKDFYRDLRNLFITNFDFNYFLSGKIDSLMTFRVNELTIISMISVFMFISFYLMMNKQLRIGVKESLVSYLVLPFYFSVFFVINSIATIITPLYLAKRGGRPWLTDKTN